MGCTHSTVSAPPERVPISTGVCGDQCVAALISVAVVCGDQYNAVLISVMCGRLGRSPCIAMTMIVNQKVRAPRACADQHGCVWRSVCRRADQCGGGVWRSVRHCADQRTISFDQHTIVLISTSGCKEPKILTVLGLHSPDGHRHSYHMRFGVFMDILHPQF